MRLFIDTGGISLVSPFSMRKEGNPSRKKKQPQPQDLSGLWSANPSHGTFLPSPCLRQNPRDQASAPHFWGLKEPKPGHRCVLSATTTHLVPSCCVLLRWQEQWNVLGLLGMADPTHECSTLKFYPPPFLILTNQALAFNIQVVGEPNTLVKQCLFHKSWTLICVSSFFSKL